MNGVKEMLVDPSGFSNGLLPTTVKQIHCNETNTYRLWTQKEVYHDAYLYKGLPYVFEGVNRITDTSSSVLASGKLICTL